MKIYAMADMHGHFEKYLIPADADLVLIAGDISKDGHGAEAVKHLNGWLCECSRRFPQTDFCLIGGNHDKFLQKHYREMRLPERFYFLCDSGVTVCGLKVYGTSWCSGDSQIFECAPGFRAMEFAKIPEGLDILISHAPPCIPDAESFDNDLCVSELTDRVAKMIRPPRLIVCGHDHNGSGESFKMVCGTKVENVSRVVRSISLGDSVMGRHNPL